MHRTRPRCIAVVTEMMFSVWKLRTRSVSRHKSFVARRCQDDVATQQKIPQNSRLSERNHTLLRLLQLCSYSSIVMTASSAPLIQNLFLFIGILFCEDRYPICLILQSYITNNNVYVYHTHYLRYFRRCSHCGIFIGLSRFTNRWRNCFQMVSKHVLVRTKELPNLKFCVISATDFSKRKISFKVFMRLDGLSSMAWTVYFYWFRYQDLCELCAEINRKNREVIFIGFASIHEIRKERSHVDILLNPVFSNLL